MIKALLFDFDGVILESASLKTIAYRKLMEEQYPDGVESFMKYHAANEGISRHVKIQYFFEKILGIEVSNKRRKELADRFSQIVFDEILQISFVEGMPGFLEDNYKKLPLFIVTGTPDEEINIIIKKRKIDIYFEGVYGTPGDKKDIILDILNRYKWNSKEVIFFGDAQTDLRAAEETGAVFVARTDGSSKALENCKYKIKDFQGFKIKDLHIRGDKI